MNSSNKQLQVVYNIRKKYCKTILNSHLECHEMAEYTIQSVHTP